MRTTFLRQLLIAAATSLLALLVPGAATAALVLTLPDKQPVPGQNQVTLTLGLDAPSAAFDSFVVELLYDPAAAQLTALDAQGLGELATVDYVVSPPLNEQILVTRILDVPPAPIGAGDALLLTFQAVDPNASLAQWISARMTFYSIDSDPFPVGPALESEPVLVETAPIPEPGSGLLLAAGLALLAMSLRRNRESTAAA